MPFIDAMHVVLAIIALVLVLRTRRLALDPNYGVLSAAAGLPLLRADRRAFGMVLLDFDNFKAFNTQHGHSTADKLVRQALRFRRSDPILVVKRGGDEIILRVPAQRSEEFAQYVATRLRAVGLTATMVAINCVQHFETDLADAEQTLLAMKAQAQKNSVYVSEPPSGRLVPLGEAVR